MGSSPIVHTRLICRLRCVAQEAYSTAYYIPNLLGTVPDAPNFVFPRTSGYTDLIAASPAVLRRPPVLAPIQIVGGGSFARGGGLPGKEGVRGGEL